MSSEGGSDIIVHLQTSYSETVKQNVSEEVDVYFLLHVELFILLHLFTAAFCFRLFSFCLFVCVKVKRLHVLI